MRSDINSVFLTIFQSVASPYFKELFVDNPSPNPVIMLRETFSEELESILHFIYNGQVQVAEESLDDFLNTAKFLQVRLFSGFKDF